MDTMKSIMTFKDNKNGISVSIPVTEVQKMFSICENSYPKETGGILIGRYSQNLENALVSEATPSPKDSKRGHTWFKRGIKGLSELIISKWKEKLYYLGEWHYHPAIVPNASYVDIRQMKNISKNPNFNCPEPILVIVSLSSVGLQLSVWVFMENRLNQLKLTENAMPTFNNSIFNKLY